MTQTLTNTQQVGHLLTANRKAQGMTQAQAAQRFGTNLPVGTHRVPKLGGVLVITP